MSKYSEIFAPTECLSEDILIKYAEGKTTDAEKHTVEKHLIDCPLCSDALEGFAVLKNSRKFLSHQADLRQRISSRVEAGGGATQNNRFFLFRYRTPLAAAASVLILISLVWFFRNNIQKEGLPVQEAEKIFADKFQPPVSVNEEGAAAGEAVPAQDELKSNGPSSHDPASSAQAQQSLNTEVKENEVTRDQFGKISTKAPLEVAATGENNKTENKVVAQITMDAEAAEEQLRQDDQDLPDVKSDKKHSEKHEESYKLSSVTETTVSGIPAQAAGNATQQPRKSVQENLNTKNSRDEAVGNITDVSKGAKLSKEEGYLLEMDKSTGKKKLQKAKAKDGAASVSDLSGGTQIVSMSQTETRSGDYRNTDTVLVMADAISSNSLSRAMDLYNSKNYSEAIPEFENVLKSEPANEQAIFYSAVSNLSTGRTGKAVEQLNILVNHKNSKYRDDAQWYLSLAYIKANDIKNARKNLSEIQNNSKSRYQKQADETLREIDK